MTHDQTSQDWEEEYSRIIGHYGYMPDRNKDLTEFNSEGFAAIKALIAKEKETARREERELILRSFEALDPEGVCEWETMSILNHIEALTHPSKEEE